MKELKGKQQWKRKSPEKGRKEQRQSAVEGMMLVWLFVWLCVRWSLMKVGNNGFIEWKIKGNSLIQIKSMSTYLLQFTKYLVILFHYISNLIPKVLQTPKTNTTIHDTIPSGWASASASPKNEQLFFKKKAQGCSTPGRHVPLLSLFVIIRSFQMNP